MGANRSGVRRKARLKRRRREVNRFVDRCAAADAGTQAAGKPAGDHTREIRELKASMKLRK
jgi:hypothetical protein